MIANKFEFLAKFQLDFDVSYMKSVWCLQWYNLLYSFDKQPIIMAIKIFFWKSLGSLLPIAHREHTELGTMVSIIIKNYVSVCINIVKEIIVLVHKIGSFLLTFKYHRY